MIYWPGKLYLDDVLQTPEAVIMPFESELKVTIFKVTLCGHQFTFYVDAISQLALKTEDYENYFSENPDFENINHSITVKDSTITGSVLLGSCLFEGPTIENGVIIDSVIRGSAIIQIFENVTVINSLIDETNVYPNGHIEDSEIRNSDICVTNAKRYTITNSNIEYSKITVYGLTDLDECRISESRLDSRDGMVFHHASLYDVDLYLAGIGVRSVLEFARIKLNSLVNLYVYKDKVGDFRITMNESTEEPLRYGSANFDEQLSEDLSVYSTVNVEPSVAFVKESIASRIKLLKFIEDQKPVL